MSFPDKLYPSIGAFFDDYASELKSAADKVSRERLDGAVDVLTQALRCDAQIFACGNGGSAAISNHLVCDHARGAAADTGLKRRVQSLSSNIELLTAIANDTDYAEVFATQLKLAARPGDVLISISSSGNSENI